MNKYYIKTVLLSALAAVLISGCKSPSPESIKRSGLYFDTYISVEIYGNNDIKLLDDVFNLCDKYEHLFSPTVNGSDIYNINHSNGDTIKISPESYNILNDSLKYCNQSDGTFDITIYPLTKLWNFSDTSSHIIPSSKEIASILPHIDYHNINMDSSDYSIYLDDKESAIDVGAIAKGYIADRIKDYLIGKDVTSAVINMGGDITLIGSKGENVPFTIGITDPNNKGNALMGLSLSDISVATSGIYERSFTEEGRLYHHILDPTTGYPCETDITSVTVITQSAEDADAICTLCILNGSDKALELINSMNDTEAIIIKRDGTVLKSKQADKYIKN